MIKLKIISLYFFVQKILLNYNAIILKIIAL